MMMAGTDDTDGFPIEILNRRRRRWSLPKLRTGADKHRRKHERLRSQRYRLEYDQTGE